MRFKNIIAYQVTERHRFLERLMPVKEEEITSYENMHTCLINMTACVCVFSVMEVAVYFLYLFKVCMSCLKEIIQTFYFSSIHG